ncbi:MAG: hypothetical protein JWR88_2434, partial [Pseudonocardia sp.]|nr:hypothetical protein [Pseudonocardia sp.]
AHELADPPTAERGGVEWPSRDH